MARYRRRMVKEKIEMNRHELQHTVRCSVRYERMTANFSRRLENAAIFLQITLGLAVFSDFASMKVVGAAVSIISIWVFVYRPGTKALLASQQQRRYEGLCVKMAGLSDTELAEQVEALGQLDSEIPDFICRAAENAEHIYNNSLAPYPLSLVQKALVRIAGS